jgi:hypothetical protein
MVKSGSFYRYQEAYFRVESKAHGGRLSFAELQDRLIQFVNSRIQNGDFTERGLAKIIGISQPQTHNVLKGARRLRPELADRLIAAFEVGVLDLIESTELEYHLQSRGACDSENLPGASPAIASHIAPRRIGVQFSPRKPPRWENQPRPSPIKEAV